MEFQQWFQTPRGRFYVTSAYLCGALSAQMGNEYQINRKPGPELAQYRYGFDNEKFGYHDNSDLPFHMIGR